MNSAVVVLKREIESGGGLAAYARATGSHLLAFVNQKGEAMLTIYPRKASAADYSKLVALGTFSDYGGCPRWSLTDKLTGETEAVAVID